LERSPEVLPRRIERRTKERLATRVRRWSKTSSAKWIWRTPGCVRTKVLGVAAEREQRGSWGR
jgi:hypothetical protein